MARQFQWRAMSSPGKPARDKALYGWPFAGQLNQWPAMASHSQPRPTIAGHDEGLAMGGHGQGYVQTKAMTQPPRPGANPVQRKHATLPGAFGAAVQKRGAAGDGACPRRIIGARERSAGSRSADDASAHGHVAAGGFDFRRRGGGFERPRVPWLSVLRFAEVWACGTKWCREGSPHEIVQKEVAHGGRDVT